MDDPEPKSLLFDSLIGISVNPFEWTYVYLLGIILVLLACSALISGSEVAYFSVGPNEKQDFKNSNDPKSQTIIDLLENPRSLLATILVANNFVNIAIVILSTYAVNLMFDFHTGTIFKFLIQVVLITFVLLLFGEVIPKVYATKMGISLALVMAYPLRFLNKVFFPMNYLLINFTSIIENKVKWKGDSLSSDDLHKALELTSDDGIQSEDQRILEGIVKFGDTDVKQIMISRIEVSALDHKDSFDEVLKLIDKNGYSRIPVYEENFDSVVGVLYIKDLLPYLNMGPEFKWFELVRKPFFVPENKKIDDLLKEFQDKKIHLAIVVDEYGGTSGIVTLEDILKEIVGDISEESEEENGVQKINDNNYLCEGKTPLIDFYKLVDVNADAFEKEKGESDTLAGFIIEISGRIPKKNEKFTFGNCLFTIESANVRRIKEIRVTLLDEKTSGE